MEIECTHEEGPSPSTSHPPKSKIIDSTNGKSSFNNSRDAGGKSSCITMTRRRLLCCTLSIAALFVLAGGVVIGVDRANRNRNATSAANAMAAVVDIEECIADDGFETWLEEQEDMCSLEELILGTSYADELTEAAEYEEKEDESDGYVNYADFELKEVEEVSTYELTEAAEDEEKEVESDGFLPNTPPPTQAVTPGPSPPPTQVVTPSPTPSPTQVVTPSPSPSPTQAVTPNRLNYDGFELKEVEEFSTAELTGNSCANRQNPMNCLDCRGIPSGADECTSETFSVRYSCDEGQEFCCTVSNIRQTDFDKPETYGQCVADNSVRKLLRGERSLGTEAIYKSSEYPYLVSIGGDDGHRCSGTVISTSDHGVAILTAAHCFTNQDDGSFERMSWVEFNRYNLNDAHDTNSDGVVRVYIRHFEDHIIRHPDFHYKDFEYDFALVILTDHSLVELAGLRTVSLNDDDAIPGVEGSALRAYGWGLNSYNPQEVAALPHDVRLDYVSNERCTKSPYEWVDGRIMDSMLCAYTERAKVCNIDSGGPLMSGSVQVGISSFIAKYDNGECIIDGYPHVYARVSKGLPWIKTIVCDKIGGDSCPRHSKSGKSKDDYYDYDFSAKSKSGKSNSYDFSYKGSGSKSGKSKSAKSTEAYYKDCLKALKEAAKSSKSESKASSKAEKSTKAEKESASPSTSNTPSWSP